MTLSITLNAVPVSGPSPLLVSFTSTTSGGVSPYTYLLEFGDGNHTAYDHNNHKYNSNGTYNAKIIVTDNNSDIAVSFITITVGTVPPLTLTQTVTPTSGNAPLTITGVVSASGGVSPYTYTWTFGDNTSASGSNVTHDYNISGTYDVITTVTDSANNNVNQSTTVTVTSSLSTLTSTLDVQLPSIVSITIGTAPYTVGFVSVPSGGTSPYNVSWDFGDGTGGSGLSITHLYQSAGTYTVTVTITDSSNNVYTQPVTLVVT